MRELRTHLVARMCPACIYREKQFDVKCITVHLKPDAGLGAFCDPMAIKHGR